MGRDGALQDGRSGKTWGILADRGTVVSTQQRQTQKLCGSEVFELLQSALTINEMKKLDDSRPEMCLRGVSRYGGRPLA
jgi:hypothetical protein